MPQVHILRDSKERTEAAAEGARGYVSERSETKDRIPPSPPVLSNFFLINYL